MCVPYHLDFTVFRVQHTLFILYASYPISWILTILAHFVCYLIVRKKVSGRRRHKRAFLRKMVVIDG